MVDPLKIIFHMSDVHIGEYGVSSEDFQRIIDEVDKRASDVGSPLLLITGDLTGDGLREEYETFKEIVERFSHPKVIVPGNHDERNYGAAHFEELLGERFQTYEDESIALYAADSAEPDNDAGHVGRAKYNEINDFFGSAKDKVRIFALHHHLIPVPHTGREHNVVEDSGDVLGVLKRSECSLVLNGHRHVPWVWRLDDMLVHTTGTLLSRRIRGATMQVYTKVAIYEDMIVFTLVDRDGTEHIFVESQLTP